MKTNRHFFMLATLLLAGCASTAPQLNAGSLPVPDHYAAVPTRSNAVAEGVSQPDWWQQYRNPTLTALVEEGLRNSPDLTSATHQLDAARGQLEAETGNSTLPRLDLGAQGARQRALGLPNLGPTFATETYDSFVGQLQASYTVDLFGAVRHANAALADRYQMRACQVDAARQALALNIVNAVITAATLQDAMLLTEQMVSLAQQQAQDAQRRHALGALAPEDLYSEQGNSAAITASLPGLRAQLASTRHALAVLLGRAPADAPPALALAELHQPEQLPLRIPSELLRARPDLRAAQAQLDAAAEDLGTANAQLYPQLTLSASMGRGGFEWGPGLSTLWGTGAALSAPLFHGGALSAQRRAAEASYQASTEDYKKAVLSAFQETADLLVALDSDTARLDALQRDEIATQANFDTAKRRAELGAVPAYLVRARALQRNRAILDANQLRAAHLTDSARLFHAMGE